MPLRPVSAAPFAIGAAALFLAAGCDDIASSASTRASSLGSEPAGTSVDQLPVLPHPTLAPVVMTESDRLVLRLIEHACRNADAPAFVDAFIASAAVRRSYLAPTVDYSAPGLSAPIPLDREEYDHFPIEMFDYYRRPVMPRGPDDYIEIIVEQGQGNQIAVEWTRVRYEGDTGEGDGLGTPYKLDGQPYRAGTSGTDGKLLFKPAEGCWQLVADIRYTTPAPRP